MKKELKVWLCPLIVAPAMAHAQIYVCKDTAGRTYTSDRPIPECVKSVVREIDRNGIVRREIHPPLTAEQKLRKQQEDERRRAEEAAAAEQRQSDRALMARFRNEQDITVARTRAIEPVHEVLKYEAEVLANLEARRAAAQAQLDQLRSSGKSIPPNGLQKLEEAEQAIAAEKKKITAYELEIAQIGGRFDGMLKRYRELVTQAAR
ncbi:MAG: hypothetical protein JWQ23_4414 [Herminiimonas sp.]|nr:hypothetical protein [Herminiimonas sp.]